MHLTHEQVVDKLDEETVSYDASLGYSGSFSELLRVSLKVEKNNYDVAVAWLKDVVYGGKFDKERCVMDVI